MDATVRFYFSEGERNGLDLDDLLVFHYVDGWTEEPGPYTHGGAGDAQYVEVQNVGGFSPFALDGRGGGLVYLPLVLRRWPPIPDVPVLHPVNNPDGDGNYGVSWSPADRADTYTLQEDDNAAFSSPTTRYIGSGTSWQATGKAPGTYYYRVKASNSWGDSGWSDLAQVTVAAAPSRPTLNPINNPGGDGSYTILWTAASGATSYVLQEAAKATVPTEGDFSGVYSGTSTSYSISGQGAARYHYRVKARNASGDSGWSNVEWVDVLWEAEPNDDALIGANGPIVSGLTYYGCFPSGADEKDYFTFDLPAAHSVELWLTNIPSGHNYDLVLRDPANMTGHVGYSGEPGNADEHILTGVLPVGRYYVQVYNRSESGSSQAYHLKVTYAAGAPGMEAGVDRPLPDVAPSATQPPPTY
jgi:hypothetical protein